MISASFGSGRARSFAPSQGARIQILVSSLVCSRTGLAYQSESRTLELLGLPRWTKVEQIRERDLMMSQEVRQMPEDPMILLVEASRRFLAGNFGIMPPSRSSMPQILRAGTLLMFHRWSLSRRCLCRQRRRNTILRRCRPARDL